MLELNEIKKLRKNLNLTQKELAKKANVSQSLIAKIESATIDPTYTKAKQIIETLNSMGNNKIKAASILNNSIIFLNSNDEIKLAIKKMKKFGISQMPVFDDKKIVGLVSESILLEALINSKKPETHVFEVMKDAPPTVTKDASIDTLTQLLREYPIILVYEKGKLIGQITKSDLINKAFK